uniref:HTH CENPB-type domain-containing protein n=1 Tax=Romanomermis culicivorax TaxID=13658 RepID=A0A915IL22_ROMCU
MSQKKRQSISIDTKLKIISESSNLSYTELAAKYNLSKNSIGSIIRSKDKLTTNVESGQFGVDCKKMRSADNVDIETCLLTWIKQARAKGIPVSGPILQEKAIDFAKQFGKTDFKCSSGWVDRFKLRHNLHRHRIQISEDFDIRNYLNADENLVVAGYMEDSEIAGLVKPTEVAEVNIFDSDDSDADDLGEENAMCSYQEAKSGIVKLRKYIMTLDDCDEKVFSMLNKIEDMCDSKHEKSMKQTSITDYLQ